jgi:hypothetical protein
VALYIFLCSYGILVTIATWLPVGLLDSQWERISVNVLAQSGRKEIVYGLLYWTYISHQEVEAFKIQPNYPFTMLMKQYGKKRNSIL